jgi:anthranilate phosphoribosyltransferase
MTLVSVYFADVMNGVLAGRHLDATAMSDAVDALIDGTWTAAQGGGFLAALAGKGEATCELVGAARALRRRSRVVEHRLPLVVDVCGTGGDRSGTINVSTCAAFVVAACGVPVAKHGNRAASSKCGSADVLQTLQVPIDASPEQAGSALERDNFAFLFAQSYHPAMKSVANLRRELGVRTVFNVIGPLANPARANRQVVGVARAEHVEIVGEALRTLGSEAGAVVHAHSGLDEVAGDGPTRVFRFHQDAVSQYEIDPADFGVEAATSTLAGGNAETNAEALLAILDGERSPRADVVALNAALALEVAQRVENLHDGFELAKSVLQSGAARDVLERSRAPRSA